MADQPQAEHQLVDIPRIFLFNGSSIHCQKFLQLFAAVDTQSTVCALPSLTSWVNYCLCLQCKAVILVACNAT